GGHSLCHGGHFITEFRNFRRKLAKTLSFRCVCRNPSHTIPAPVFDAGVRGSGREERVLTLTCPRCGDSQNFLVKTFQMHVVHLEDSRVEVSEESRPAVFEVLCDECETALNFEEFEDALRKEVLLTLGAR